MTHIVTLPEGAIPTYVSIQFQAVQGHPLHFYCIILNYKQRLSPAEEVVEYQILEYVWTPQRAMLRARKWASYFNVEVRPNAERWNLNA